ncbi:nucleotidyltransferase family protein [Candidatus Poriferisocius sp.]|uniref:nucleotidyltransferase family protein n=1 Tax=Candidatus Poriferisocius sp. TaxID=3101276 RepID=UPI003B015C19
MFTLVVMAAGLGSRFGGTKQLAQVGPNGEAFLDFAIADAAAAGADRVVLIVRSDIEADVQRHFEARGGLPGDLDVAYVCQDEHGPTRPKPWGTAHAVLSAAEAVAGPFMVCNADDYYGPTAYDALAHAIHGMADDEAGLCGYRLDHTLPAEGAVTRGVCQVDGDRLTGIVEREGISRADNHLPEDTIVSMNLWAFSPTFFDALGDGYERFLEEHRDSPTAEYLLPHAVATEMERGALTVKVVTTEETWIGVTNPDDLKVAQAALKSR